MTKKEILDMFSDIDFVYNNSSKYETLSWMLDELLKEQEPHVLTLDEAFDLQEKTPYPCIFVDIKWRNDVFLAFINDKIYGDYHSDDFKVNRPWLGADRIYHKAEYGKSIRFWNLFPTDKQRKAVNWE